MDGVMKMRLKEWREFRFIEVVVKTFLVASTSVVNMTVSDSAEEDRLYIRSRMLAFVVGFIKL